MKTKSKLMVAEIVLILASVLIFRGLWLLLDKIPIMRGMPALLVSLVVGIAFAIPALQYIIRKC